MFLKATKDVREHTNSYYAATINNPSNYPSLEGEITTDVCVIGGGFSGVNTALELAERGFNVVLLEANRIGWGATGRNGGQIIGGIGHKLQQFKRRIGDDGIKTIQQAGWECCEIIRERVAKYHIDCDLSWGYADVAIKPRHIDELKAFQAEQQAAGYPYKLEWVEAEQMREHHVNSKSYLGALVNKDGYGHVHPLNLCRGEAAAAASLGTQIFEQSKVVRVIEGDRPKVITENGAVTANFVVHCGNAYMGNLQPKLAKKILPATSCVIATEPLGDLAKDIMPGNLAVCDPNTALDYFRLSADGRLLFGGLSNYTGLEPKNLIGTMQARMLKVFPELASSTVDFGWSGNMGIGINRMPQLGRLSHNVFYIQAYSGHGVAPTHLTARVTADMIAQQAERFDVFAKIHHWNWPGGKLLRRPGMALGMLWFKLLDEL